MNKNPDSSISQWLVFNIKWRIYQLYIGENKLYFDEITIMSALFHTNTLTCIFVMYLVQIRTS